MLSTYQDSDGYIWIATFNGLQRYDGYRFRSYRADVHNPDALQTDYIHTIFEDSRRRLWIGTGNEAAYLFDRATGRFYNFNAHCSNKADLINGVWKFLEDGRGDIWISEKAGFFRLNNKTNQFENCDTLFGIGGKIKPWTFERDKEGNLWVITTAGLLCYNVKTGRITDRTNNPGALKLFDIPQTITQITFDEGHNAWILTVAPALIYKFDFKTNRIKSYSFEHMSGTAWTAHRPKDALDVISKDRKGGIMVAVGSAGLAIYDEGRDAFSVIPIRNEDPYGLHSTFDGFENIYPFMDREGNVWIGTDKGLNIFNFDKQRFHYYGSGNSFEDTRPYPSCPVSDFLQIPEDGDLYVGYYDGRGGILRLDSNLRFKRQYLLDGPVSLKNQIWCLFQDDKGIIWAPNQDKTILRLDRKRDRLTNTVDDTLSGCINVIRKDEQGDVWMGHWSKGLIRMDHRTHLVRAFTNPPAGLTYPVKNVSCIYLDEGGIIWAGTPLQGLLRFDKAGGVFTDAFLFDERNKESISSNTVTCIAPYNRDTLLVATGTGIDIFDKRKGTFSTISGKDGLLNTYIQSLAIDDRGYVWAACLSGFCRVNIHTREITNYDASDGISCLSFEDRPFLRLANGNFLVAGSKGFMVFNPDSIGEKKAPPDVTITDFRIYDKGVDALAYVNGLRPLELAYGDNNINIEFSALQYSTPGEVRYFYQLEGVDKDWVSAGRDQAAKYNQLRSGHYLFKVKCRGRNGVISRGITLLPLYIVPPFWETWWFYLVVILLAMSAVFLSARWFHNRKKEKELLHLNYERKIAVMEMNTLRAQMNPHFIFNSLNSINTFILKNDQDNATDYLSKFSQLVRLILDNSRTEWVLLENELRALELYVELESLRFDKAFTYSICVGPDVFPAQVVVPPLIIQPYVENAIWHGLMHLKKAGGKITIDIWKENESLMIQIADNGVGRARAEKLERKRNTQHKSHGMKITAERLAVVNEVYNVNATVTVTDLPGPREKATGTRVLLTIQYKTHAGLNH